MKAMILAAGSGTRMRPLTLNTPKPLLKIAGKPLIEYTIERLVKAGYKNLVINHAWLGEQIEAALGSGARLGAQIYYSPEKEPLETAGGIRAALEQLSTKDKEPFLVVNGDIFSDYPFEILPKNIDGLAHLVLIPNPAHNLAGDFFLTDNRVTGVGDSKYTFSGISILSPQLFKGLAKGKPAALAPLLQQAIEREKVTAELFSGCWIDVGTPERLEYVEQLLTEKNSIQ